MWYQGYLIILIVCTSWIVPFPKVGIIYDIYCATFFLPRCVLSLLLLRNCFLERGWSMELCSSASTRSISDTLTGVFQSFRPRSPVCGITYTLSRVPCIDPISQRSVLGSECASCTPHPQVLLLLHGNLVLSPSRQNRRQKVGGFVPRMSFACPWDLHYSIFVRRG